jgi:RNA polymerase sigma-70 factor (ECF subfamily)
LSGDRDHELIANVLQGNQKAFRQIVERHHSLAFAVVRSILGDRDDVEDVLQNAFIKVYRGLHSFQGRSKLSTWIYQIARNEAITALHRRPVEYQPVDEIDRPAPDTDNPERQYENSELREHLEAALSHLQQDHRMAIELHYLGEHSYEEIAEIMDIPIGTVKTYIYRGKIELRRIMTKRKPIIQNGEVSTS